MRNHFVRRYWRFRKEVIIHDVRRAGWDRLADAGYCDRLVHAVEILRDNEATVKRRLHSTHTKDVVDDVVDVALAEPRSALCLQWLRVGRVVNRPWWVG